MQKMIAQLFILIMLFTFSHVRGFSQAGKTKWTGTASYYHTKFEGRKTSSGERFSNHELTAANNFLALGTKVKITNLKNKKSVLVTINDRMNAHNRRLVDVSKAAAQRLGFCNQGLCRVMMEVEIPHKKSTHKVDKKNSKAHLSSKVRSGRNH